MKHLCKEMGDGPGIQPQGDKKQVGSDIDTRDDPRVLLFDNFKLRLHSFCMFILDLFFCQNLPKYVFGNAVFIRLSDAPQEGVEVCACRS